MRAGTTANSEDGLGAAQVMSVREQPAISTRYRAGVFYGVLHADLCCEAGLNQGGITLIIKI